MYDIMFIFDRCHRSWAAEIPVKYEHDLKYLTYYCNWEINKCSFSTPHPWFKPDYALVHVNQYSITHFTYNDLIVIQIWWWLYLPSPKFYKILLLTTMQFSEYGLWSISNQ